MIEANKTTIAIAVVIVVIAVGLLLLISQPTVIPIPGEPDLSIEGLPSDTGLGASTELSSEDLGDVYTKTPTDLSIEELPSESGLDTTTEEGSGELGDVY